MKQKNNDLFSEILVGAFMVAVLALLAYFTIVISGVDVFFGREKVDARIEFADVGGLRERDNVVYHGMKVGTVERIELGGGRVRVTARINGDVVLRDTYRISVTALSLLGGNCLTLEEGTGEPKPLTTTLFRGEPPLDWMRDLGRIAQKLNDLADEGALRSIMTNFEATAGKVSAIAARVERGEGTLGKLFSPDDSLYRDATQTVASAKAVAQRLERGEGTLGKILSGDESLYRDVTNAFASAAEVAARLARGEGTLGRLTSSDDTVYDDVKAVLDELKKAVADMKTSLANVKTVAARVERGEGLLGRLTKDEKLSADAARMVANLEDVSRRLAAGEGTLGKLVNSAELHDEVSALVKDVRQMVDNYRDTTPISTFGSLVGGAL